MTQQNISLDLPKFEIKFCCNTNRTYYRALSWIIKSNL